MNIVIFGATGGIGAALTPLLANKRNNLFLVGRNQDRLLSLANKTRSSWSVCDATRVEDVGKIFAKVTEDFGGVDGVVSCIGSILLKPVHLTTDHEFDDVLQTNLLSSFVIMRATVRCMMRSGGSLVLTSSAAARTGIANHEAIAAAKAGVMGLALSAAATYAPRGIRVNVVAPGMVETPLTESLLKSSAARNMSESMHALKKIGKPEDVASMMAWLLSPEQSWVTGQVFGVDGGLSTLMPRIG